MSAQQDRDDLDQLLAEVTEEEITQAQALREALEQDAEHPDAELCRALRAADSPSELDPALNEHLVQAALFKARPSRQRRLAALLATATALAVAAGVLLTLGPSGRQSPSPRPSLPAHLEVSRSTQTLFDSPFPTQGGNSERMDRIVQARARDYRSNLFERKGVRP